MLIAHSLAELAALPGADRRAVISIGNFDGVHIGHQAILADVCHAARSMSARSVVVTFEPHPAHVLGTAENKPPLPLITPLPRKLELLAETGLDVAVVLPFSEELRQLSAREFVQQVLCGALRTAEVHEGEGFRFGHRAEGDLERLALLGREWCFAVQAHRPVWRRGGVVSSSRIRKLVAQGDIHTARVLLGRPFSMDSTPARGRGYGTRYAVPTINLATPPELVPGHGVYATTLRIGSPESAITFAGVTNVGNRPTFGEDSFAIETHLFDFRPVDLEASTPLRLTFLSRLREEHRFPSPEALKKQIQQDVARAQSLFRRCKLATLPA